MRPRGGSLFPEQISTSASRLDITTIETGGLVRFVLAGELDATEDPRLREAVALAVARGRPIGIDAAGLTFLDSGGIRALLACRRLVENAGLPFSIVEAGTVAYQVLQITGLLRTFDVPAHRGPSS
ncbi:STAS domain-containing protein [Actinoplanes sp. LDG1-06]|uniref:STAS domain-containing protein n=1 Tax=Paractinoplanes ovalisporus TaxID=2810368 RepID=A0ABS2ATY3_9ACTN|nr:STAS domain-containing protein [Actinoplanes ovalisporus]MBM2622639.1 STAS domain-containing protein [Actinoplanes ovalisporus]